MDTIGSTCPICGDSGLEESLSEHLNSHSKADLIQLLLQQQQQSSSSSHGTVRTHQRAPVSSISLRSGRVLQNGRSDVSETSSIHEDASEESILSLPHSSSQDRQHHMCTDNVGQLNPVAIKSDPNAISLQQYELENVDDDDNPRYDLVPVCSFSIPLSDEHDELQRTGPMCRNSLRPVDASEIHDEDENSHPEMILLQSFAAENSEPSACQDEHTRHEERFQEESDNATSQTSIIKYIIDQTDNRGSTERQGEPERWVLPDGRTIPVYSSFTQVHIVPQPDSSATPGTDPLASTPNEEAMISVSTEKHGGGGHVQLDLMTDEQIPPRGEISEYEESNTSSFVSEDSNIRLANLTDSRRGSPMILAEMESPTINKRKRKRKSSVSGTERTSKVTHQFLCYECPKVQKFKSLFELIGHKMKAHPSKPGNSSISNASVVPSSSSSSLHLSKVDVDEKVLPEPAVEENKKKTQKKEFFCVYCDFICNNKSSLSQHMETEHTCLPAKPTIFECNTCGKIFPARTNLRKHLLVHKERKHVCTVCKKGFTSNFKLMEHSRVHTQNYPFKCEHCEKCYRTPSLLNYHVKSVHRPASENPPKQKVEFYCGICHKILRSKRSFTCHTQVHHAKPKKCPYCCESFIRPSVLVRHIRVTHDPRYESLESKDCPVCHKKLHPNSIIKHMRIHANEKPYPCQVCGKNFRTYANLQSHSWSHTNLDKPFKCQQCPKSYLFKKTLEHHMMVHKRRTLHFVCNECGVKFTHKVNMKRHLEEHFSEKKFECKTCGKAFQRNYYLLEHERIHSGLKPFVCNICGKASTTKSNHRAHIKIHDARDSGSQEG